MDHEDQRLVDDIRRKRQAGVNFGRYVQCLASSKGNLLTALGRAAQIKDAPLVREAVQKLIDAGSSSDATWAGPLVQSQPLASEFVELLRGLTVLGRLPVRRVPFNVRFSRATSGTSASWVGQGKPSPVSAMDFEGLSLVFAKIVSIAVITKELAENSTPAAAATVAQDIATTVASFMDVAFLDPDAAAIADKSPASITHGAPSFDSSGNSFAQVVADLKMLMESLATSPGVRLRDAVWVMSERVALHWATLYNTNSDLAFEDLGPAGGTLFNLPVLTTGSLPSANSPTEECVTLLSPSLIAVADDGNTSVDVGQNSLQMLTNPSDGAATNVSLWQNNLIGLKLMRVCNWVRRRDGCVAVLRGVNL